MALKSAGQQACSARSGGANILKAHQRTPKGHISTNYRAGFTPLRLALITFIIAWASSLLAGCARATAAPPAPVTRTESGTLILFAAASLTNAFEAIGAAFMAEHPQVNVLPNFDASSRLAVQLIEAAPAHVFASADSEQMEMATASGRIRAAPRPFAGNRLVLIAPAANPAGILQFQDLAKPDVFLVTAVPGVPIRAYTEQMLNRLSERQAYGPAFVEAVRRNVVSEELNVRQVVAKVALGEADAAIVYQSDITPDVAQRVIRVEIPSGLNVVATYFIAPVGEAPYPSEVVEFVDFVLAPEGQAILREWGFEAAPHE